tara:strand:+ start:32471 stop:34390 length:1920 start_codon:yes stop_codon:yes gene_type:complete
VFKEEKVINKINNLILKLNTFQRRLFLIFIDSTIISLSFQITLSLLNLNQSNQIRFLANLFAIIFFITINIATGEYRGITRFTGSLSFYKSLIRNVFSSLTLFIFCSFFIPKNNLLNILILNCILVSSSCAFIRVLIRDLILDSNKSFNNNFINIAIYGAGYQGIQFAMSLRYTKNYKLICFFDDNKELEGRNINGIPIFLPNEFDSKKLSFTELIIAIPNLKNEKKRSIFEKFYGVNIFSVPLIKNAEDARKSIDKIKPFRIEDLLGREPRAPIQELMELSGIRNNIICVTGAGGSIGSELCLQIINLKPKKLVCIEISEHNLYKVERSINEELDKLSIFNKPEIIYVLGDVSNPLLIEESFKVNKINIVFHAAAYKHVPIVEINPIIGIRNNFLSTKVLCEKSIKFNISKFVFISTDKAVRPTNIMGASKRAAELLINSYSQKIKTSENKTLFSIVRFGNVIGSSGSVIPLFKEQISKGGPLTITHEEITRYFMTISEAVQLVIQTCALTEGSDLFLLDMGKQVKIVSLAKNLLRLSNLRIKDELNPDGDIEIKFTGLRPGEKLYEELLIESNSIPTEHPLIYKASPAELSVKEEYEVKFDELESNINHHKIDEILDTLYKIVPSWQKYIFKDKWEG